MAGLFGLFGGKKKEEAKKNSSDNSFFLTDDDAKTLGNIDYMRKTVEIKRTFPNTVAGKGAKISKLVSSSDMKVIKNNQIQTPSVKKQETVTESKTTIDNLTEKRRQSDNSMDMFRKMAKDIKK